MTDVSSNNGGLESAAITALGTVTLRADFDLSISAGVGAIGLDVCLTVGLGIGLGQFGAGASHTNQNNVITGGFNNTPWIGDGRCYNICTDSGLVSKMSRKLYYMLKSKKSIRRIIVITSAVFIVGFLSAMVFNLIIKVMRASIDNPIHIASVSPNDYHLISGKYTDKLKEGVSYQSSNSNPVEVFHFDNKYRLISYKIDLINKASLSEVVDIIIKSVDRTSNEVYKFISQDLPFRFQYREVPVMPVSKIYLTLSGDSLQNVQQNDSIISHYLICRNMSIRYKVKEPLDIFLVGPDRAFGTTATFPMDLLLLKKDSAVYLMIMTPDASQRTIAPDLLYNIVTGR